MPLVAIRVSDNKEIESFAVSDDLWAAMRKEPKGTYVIPVSNWPAVLKRSIKGTQFFAHSSGYVGKKSEPESEAHRVTKIAISIALRSAGYPAWVERSGNTPDGKPWQADVLCEALGRKIAFEVQLAQQTLQDYEERTSIYEQSGIKCIWLVKSFNALSKAIIYRLPKPNKPVYGRPALKSLAVVPFEIGIEKSAKIEDMRVVVFLDKLSISRITLSEFAIGVAEGRFVFSTSAQEWRWLT